MINQPPQALARTGLGRSTNYPMMARGELPRPVGLGARAVGWNEGDLAAWLATRIRTDV